MPDVSDRYVEHTLIGDPLAEAMTKDLAGLGTRKTSLLIEAAMNEEGEEALRDAPASLRAFFNDAETPTEWLDYSAPLGCPYVLQELIGSNVWLHAGSSPAY